MLSCGVGAIMWSKMQSQSLLKEAYDMLDEGNLEGSEAACRASVSWLNDEETNQRTEILLARILLHVRDTTIANKPNDADSQWHLKMGQQRQEAARALNRLENIPAHSPNYAESKWLLATEAFFHAERFRNAEQHIDEGLQVSPNDPALFFLRWQLLAASGRWLEAAEQLPTDALKNANEDQQLSLIRQYTLLCLFPDEFNLQTDRQLGILAHNETRNANTDLDRWVHFVSADSTWTPAYAAIASWYRKRELISVAQTELKKGEMAFRDFPTASYLYEYMALFQSGEGESEQQKLFTQLATPARIARSKALASSERSTEEALNDEVIAWPLAVDRELLERVKSEPEISNSKSVNALSVLERWTKQRKPELLAALQDPADHLSLLAECWRDFGQMELADIIERLADEMR